MSRQQNKQPILRNGKKIFEVDCIIADQTHNVKLVLLEEVINQVHCGKSYLFRGLTTRVFDDVKYLSTNEATTIIKNRKMTLQMSIQHQTKSKTPVLRENV